MQTDTDGKNLNLGPAQRYVTISWGEQGLNGDLDVDDNATIELYYSTRTDFRDSRGSVAYTSGNSDGSDILGAITQGNNDTHKIGDVSEDPDGQFDNQFTWDIWDYTSAEGTVPQTDARYYIYALLKGGNGCGQRRVRWTFGTACRHQWQEGIQQPYGFSQYQDSVDFRRLRRGNHVGHDYQPFERPQVLGR